MGFRLQDHTADVAVEATATDLDGVFAAVADGLAAASCDDIPDSDPASTFEVSVAAESREALLFDYLDQLIYERDVRGVLPVRNRAEVAEPDGPSGTDDDAWRVDATARGLPLKSVDAREIKAVTYSEMRIEPTDEGWTAYVVFDV
jgi:SHS2 domain-containing protein